MKSLLVSVLALLFAASLAAVPAPPINLTSNVTGNTVTLSWTAPAGSVLAYRLEAGSAPGLSNVANSIVGLATSLTVVNIPPGTYYVRVRAIGSDGESAPSNEATVIVGGGTGCTTAPNAPQLSPAAVAGNGVMFAWAAALTGCAATSYSLQAGSAPGLANLAIVNVGPALSFAASAPDGTYYVRVVASNAYGTSPPSNEVSFTLGAPLWSMSGTGNTVFDMPASVSRVRVVGTFTGNSSNFVIYVNGRLLVNELLGTAWGTTRYEGIHLTGGGVVEIRFSSAVRWEMTQVR